MAAAFEVSAFYSGAFETETITAVTGVFGTGQIGTATATGAANVVVTGVSGTGNLGQVVVSLFVSVTGVFGTGAIGSAVLPLPNWTLINTQQTPTWAQIDDTQNPYPTWVQVNDTQNPYWTQIAA